MNKDRIHLMCGDFREVGKEIEDNSVDMIFTDPPYLKEYIPLYEDLGILGKRVLKVGGSLITYVNHHFIPEILDLMKDNLKYLWIVPVKQSGPMAKIKGYGILVRQKPLLWFVKEKYKVNHLVIDFIVSKYQGKDHHVWQQSKVEAEYLIRQITNIGDTILDPFMGSGTTGIVASQYDRKFIGIEKEEEYFKIAEKRIKESQTYQLTQFQGKE